MGPGSGSSQVNLSSTLYINFHVVVSIEQVCKIFLQRETDCADALESSVRLAELFQLGFCSAHRLFLI